MVLLSKELRRQIMNTHEYSSRPRLFVAISSLIVITLLLAACGGLSTSGGAATPTPGKTATLQTSCPPAGKARAAIMAPLALGNQNTIVYAESQPPLFHPTSVTLKRYTISTRTTTDIVTLPNTNIYEAQISADGQWVLLHTNVSNQPAIQLVRIDGQMLQTLYCSAGLAGMQWSPDNKYVAFVDSGTPGTDLSKSTFNLLTVATGAIQTKPHDSNHLLYIPLAWLDNTHLYVETGVLPGEGSTKLFLLDITTGTSKQIVSLSDHCFDTTHSIDGTQLFTSSASQCGLGDTAVQGGPSIIQVQPAIGGLAKTIYSTPTEAITALRVASSTTLLLITRNMNTDTICFQVRYAEM
jgi:eukaryotic-like serine/threonine-protein kinase